MAQKYICPVCGGDLIVLIQVTEQYGVNKRTGTIGRRMLAKSAESSWVRCENSCRESIDLFEDDTVIPDEVIEKAE